MWWYLIAALFALSSLSSACASVNNNIEWTRINNISIVEVNAPRGSWEDLEKFLYSTKINPNVIMVVNIPFEHWDMALRKFRVRIPGLILDSRTMAFVKVIGAPCFFYPPNIIYRTGNYPCLDHEVGHFREYIEGVPYHSKYAY